MEGETTTAPAETTTTTTAPAETKPAETAQTTTETKPAETTSAEPNPFLGETKPTEQKPTAEQKPAEKPKEYTEEDYAKAIVKDEKLLGDNKAVQIDAGYIKAMAPAFKEAGVSPEQANKLANAFAKVQMDSAREATKGRREYFEKMKAESMQKYSEKDFEQINRGIDSCFDPKGVMNYVIRNSELGADPEFLALMHKMGASVKTDTVAGAASGSGTGTGDGNSFAGISSMW